MRQNDPSGSSCRAGYAREDDHTRANALWGKGRRHAALLVVLAVVAAALAAGSTTAAGAPPQPSAGFVPAGLQEKAKAHPNDTFQVIVQSSNPGQLDELGSALNNAQKKHPGTARGLRKKFKLIAAATAVGE